MAKKTVKKIDWDKEREQWRALVEELMADIARWAEEEGWLVHRDTKVLTEEHLGEYVVPDLVIRFPGGRVYVEVGGREVLGADGRVDIESFPNFARMILVRKRGMWKVKTDAFVDWPQPWCKETFIALAKTLASAG